MKIRFQLVFIESVCGDEGVINSNIREVKLQSPDYKGIEEEVAVRESLHDSLRCQFLLRTCPYHR